MAWLCPWPSPLTPRLSFDWMTDLGIAAHARSSPEKTAIVDGNVTAMSSSKATWELNVPSTSTITVNITNSTGQTVFTGNYSANAGDNQPFSWDGKGNDGTQYPDGLYKLTATAKDSSGNPVHFVVDGKLDNILSYKRTLAGTWNHGNIKGDFKVTRD